MKRVCYMTLRVFVRESVGELLCRRFYCICFVMVGLFCFIGSSMVGLLVG